MSDVERVFLIQRRLDLEELTGALWSDGEASMTLMLKPELDQHTLVIGRLLITALRHVRPRRALCWAGQIRFTDNPEELVWASGGWDFVRGDGTCWTVAHEEAALGPKGLGRYPGWGEQFFWAANDQPDRVWVTQAQVHAAVPEHSRSLLVHTSNIVWDDPWIHGRLHPSDYRTRIGPDGQQYIDWRGLVAFINRGGHLRSSHRFMEDAPTMLETLAAAAAGTPAGVST